MIIAVDGPAASGKGTLARKLAHHYGLKHLDTGAIYRAIALEVLKTGRDPGDEAAAVAAAKAYRPDRFRDAELRTEAVSRAASIVAAFAPVRAEVVGLQRKVAHTPPGAVLDGRDIGTIVCPEAEVKFFVTASAEERARRRVREFLARGESVDEASILAEIVRRDERDRTRHVAPLRPAADAHLLDTTTLDIEAAFQAARRIVDGH
ncbi:MAG TPA: (d)CMP kinase [Aestuariivirgaceae bacterium]|nr:(d)CMP kinase [Aestuariivirgaceae bacterium]